MWRRASRRRDFEKPSTSSLRKRTRPDVGSTRRRTQRPVVVFPLPDSPTNPNVSPVSIEKLTSSTALTIVPDRNRPRSRAKCFTRCETSTRGIGWGSGLTARNSGLAARGSRLGTRGSGVVQVTLGRASRADVVIVGRRRRARPETIGAARVEGASRRQGAENRHRAFDRVQARPRFAGRQRSEKPARIWVLRLAKHFAHRTVLDNATRVHHGHVIGGFRNHAKVVRDQQEREIESRF